MSRAAWLAAAEHVLAGEVEDLQCPACDQPTLAVERLPTGDRSGGEYHLHCDRCGAENFVLKRGER